MPYAQLTERLAAFGDPNPDVLFLGMEEACEDEHDHRIRAHMLAERAGEAAFQPMDVVAYHEEIDRRRMEAVQAEGIPGAINLTERLFGRDPNIQSTWRGLIRFQRAFATGSATEIDVEEVRTTQRDQWGRAGNGHALAEFLPLAHKKADRWYPQGTPGQWWRTRARAIAHFTTLAQGNAHPVQRFINTTSPRVVVAYSTMYHDRWRALLRNDTPWQLRDADGQQVAYRLVRGRLELLTPHSTAHGITNQFWTSLGAWARAQIDAL